jgi:hypothetical protein
MTTKDKLVLRIHHQSPVKAIQQRVTRQHEQCMEGASVRWRTIVLGSSRSGVPCRRSTAVAELRDPRPPPGFRATLRYQVTRVGINSQRYSRSVNCSRGASPRAHLRARIAVGLHTRKRPRSRFYRKYWKKGYVAAALTRISMLGLAARAAGTVRCRVRTHASWKNVTAQVSSAGE